MSGDGRLRHLARGRVGPVRRRGHRALRQQRGADLRRRRRVRDPRPARPDQHPDARGVTHDDGELGDRTDPQLGHRWADPAPGSAPTCGSGSRVRRSGRLLVSLWVLVTASFLMIHLIPGDPVRGGPRADGAGRPGRRPAGVARARTTRSGSSTSHYLHGLFTGDLGTSLVSQLPVSRRDRAAAAGHARAGACWRSWRPCSIAVPLGVAMGVLTRRGHGRRTELGVHHHQRRARHHPRLPARRRARLRLRRQPRLAPGRRQRQPRRRTCCPSWRSRSGPAAILARIVRVEMVAVLEADYVRTARAKRLPGPHRLPRPRPARTRSPPPSRWAACCSARWSPAPCWSRTSSPGPGSAARSCSRSSTRTTRVVQAHRARVRRRRAAGQHRRRRRAGACSTRARRSGRTEHGPTHATLVARAPHPARAHRDGAHGRRAGARRRRADPVDRPGRRGRHQRHPGRARRPSTGPAPTTSAATSSTACWWRPGCRSSSPCSPPPSRVVVGLVLGTAPFLLGRRAGRAA